ncbi:GSCFA domain-containing protein [Thalassotalea castellviae]|uniref:GSCFA domain-containing protein n=1 Tax=Thalassotalea castellviae TaxID=3075612 RepID=A0ABU2ZY62_9GAMM|nr:GSCFA domain-containing protein [Thalassotalea sp. W431]MDT0602862.1 GSCFA domain-containing protein [Thalassotalea sp. W431]
MKSIKKVNLFHGASEHEITTTIEDETYHLMPDAHYNLHSYFEKKHRYAELNSIAKKAFTRESDLIDSELNHHHQMHYKHAIPADLCQKFIQQVLEDKTAFNHHKVITSILDLILDKNLDQVLSSYFNSEYTLSWYSYLETLPDRENRSYSSYWHCDGGPENHLKILIYLNPYKEHLGNTKFLTKETTDKLKKVGCLFNDIEKRTENLAPLANAKGIELEEIMYENIEAGDALIFNPNQLAHIGKIPETGTRHVLQLCFIPSPLHWKDTINHAAPIQIGCQPFEGLAEKLLNYYDKSAHQVPDNIMIPDDGTIQSSMQLRWLIENIFPDKVFAETMFTRLIELDPKLEYLHAYDNVFETLKLSFRDSINWGGEIDREDIEHLAQLTEYLNEFTHSCERYAPTNKPNHKAIYWPNPEHEHHPSSKYQVLPYVKKYPIMDKSTPIGSAGSCFAFEIARVFQESGFNYVVTERNDDPMSGVLVDGYSPGDQYAKFCANYGILFNSISFKQLAEKAFDTKPIKQLLFQQPQGYWVDPYREGVAFLDRQNYLLDYPQHINATRNALEMAEVFIITLGLNECWEFRDGTVLSRNPRDNMYPYVKHKTLSVQENIENIQSFFDTIKKFNPNFKLIISISPIPFLATGHGETKHVITANTHSKATLRVAAEELVNNNEDIYYLPSYELVTECIEDAWDNDQRHVKRSTVEKVVEMFKDIFVKT